MPIKIPNNLPAAEVLQRENIFVMDESRAATQDIRPLQILLLNLMPKKVETETQLSRLLGNTPLQVELELIHTETYESKNVTKEHMLTFYKTFADVKHRNFDGLIITGAPVEHMPFEEVEYWDELCTIMEWSKTHVHSTFHICWGAQAGLYYHFGIQKHTLPAKLSGVYPHVADYKNSMLLRGFDDVFPVPQSRHTTVDRADVERVEGLKILASSEECGVYAMATKTASRSSSPDIPNTMPTRSPTNTTAISVREKIPTFRCITSRTTIPLCRRRSPGALTPICSTRTG